MELVAGWSWKRYHEAEPMTAIAFRATPFLNKKISRAPLCPERTNSLLRRCVLGPRISFEDEYRSILLTYGWREDPSARDNSRETWFPPNGLPFAGISIVKRQGFWCWETLDFEDNELVDVGPESLEAHLASRQPDVDLKRK